MTFIDSLLVALFGLSVVFLVLILLSLLVKIQSLILGYIIKHNSKVNETKSKDIKNTSDNKEKIIAEDEQWSAGELKLIGVDEKTAAMIMAIVSDESQIPLSELIFRSIKAID
jgi:Na+-transporting methylmalonyl-CoA/oxaloacetate decarboxylase gamma subunit